MRIGELARAVGVSASALRYYEDVGVLAPPRRIAGRRDYGRADENALRFVLAAQRAGFTLAETRSLLALLHEQDLGAERWRAMADGKLAELDATIRHLRVARRALREALDCACRGNADDCKLVTARPAAERPGPLRRPRRGQPRGRAAIRSK